MSGWRLAANRPPPTEKWFPIPELGAVIQLPVGWNAAWDGAARAFIAEAGVRRVSVTPLDDEMQVRDLKSLLRRVLKDAPQKDVPPKVISKSTVERGYFVAVSIGEQAVLYYVRQVGSKELLCRFGEGLKKDELPFALKVCGSLRQG